MIPAADYVFKGVGTNLSIIVYLLEYRKNDILIRASI